MLVCICNDCHSERQHPLVGEVVGGLCKLLAWVSVLGFVFSACNGPHHQVVVITEYMMYSKVLPNKTDKMWDRQLMMTPRGLPARLPAQYYSLPAAEQHSDSQVCRTGNLSI